MDQGRNIAEISANNLITGNHVTDHLMQRRELMSVGCTRDMCGGAFMGAFGFARKTMNKTTQVMQAREFLQEYHRETGRNEADYEKRWNVVMQQIIENGHYDLTSDELKFGARTAWRNAPRCPGRTAWNTLALRDCRHVTSVEEVFNEICTHIKESSNNGNIIPTISVFPERRHGRHDQFRVWNAQLINFAGYTSDDDVVIGDKGNFAFTKFCQDLGWKGKNGQFDVLPLILSGPDGEPKWFEIPNDIIMKVSITHPTIEAFAGLGLEWYGLPCVSGMLLEVGGIQFPCCPFSGWYCSSEIATRDLLDVQRYNLAQEIANAIGLDTSNLSNLWKDKVNTELTIAVLNGYRQAGIAIVDHYTLADQFIAHFNHEHKVRGGCPADWVWVVPPLSSGLTPAFHQEMACYHLSPSYEYQEPLWKKYNQGKSKEKRSIAGVGKAIWFMTALFSQRYRQRSKAYVFYGTMTGTSKLFAASLVKCLDQMFHTTMHALCDESLDALLNINRENSVVFIVTSTTGQGEPPSQAIGFKNELESAVKGGQSDILKGLRYGVFALGASFYEEYFCSFGKFCDAGLSELGATRILDMGCGDQLKCQDRAFKNWVRSALRSVASMLLMPLTLEVESNWPFSNPRARKASWATHSFKLSSKTNDMKKFHGTSLEGMKLMNGALIQKRQLSARYILVTIGFPQDSYVTFEPGDHIYIFPQNPSNLVNQISEVCTERPSDHEIVVWQESDVPPSTLAVALTNYVDISSCPSQEMIQTFIKYAGDESEAEKLGKMVTSLDEYVALKDRKIDLVRFFQLFKSIRIPAAVLIASLNKLMPRAYSVASAEPKRTLVSGRSIPVVDVLFELVETETEFGVKKGVCTDFMNRLDIGGGFLCYQGTTGGQFKMPDDPNLPIIMVAAGSGIAPFRAFWQTRAERHWPKEPAFLYFGCRDSTEDMFDSESQRSVQRRVAYSRQEGALIGKKAYVQELLTLEGSKLYDALINQHAVVFICGKVPMKSNVMKAIETILAEHGHLNKIQIEDCIFKLKREGKIVEEFFG